jgi:hypothetical protein
MACSKFKPNTLNRVLAESPLLKLAGTKLLEIISAKDVGSCNEFGLKCDVRVFANTGGAITVVPLSWVSPVAAYPPAG